MKKWPKPKPFFQLNKNRLSLWIITLSFSIFTCSQCQLSTMHCKWFYVSWKIFLRNENTSESTTFASIQLHQHCVLKVLQSFVYTKKTTCEKLWIPYSDVNVTMMNGIIATNEIKIETQVYSRHVFHQYTKYVFLYFYPESTYKNFFFIISTDELLSS